MFQDKLKTVLQSSTDSTCKRLSGRINDQFYGGTEGCKSTSMSSVELLIQQHSQVLLLRTALNLFFTQPLFVLHPACAFLLVQDLALGLAEFHEVCMDPPVKPTKVLLGEIPEKVDRKESTERPTFFQEP